MAEDGNLMPEDGSLYVAWQLFKKLQIAIRKTHYFISSISMCFRRSSNAFIIYLPIAFITAIAPVHEVPRAPRNYSTEHSSLVDDANTERNDGISTVCTVILAYLVY